MPITLGPVSRRQFLAGTVAFGLGTLFERQLHADEERADPHRLALLSDIHIAADPAHKERGVVMFDHLKQVVGEVLALSPKPASVLIDGDCAFKTGETADYQTLTKLLQPLREAGLPLHLEMGNHDNRQHMYDAVPDSQAHVQALPDRQIMVLEYPRANVVMIDSLQATNHTPGRLGTEQIEWLKKELDQISKKPALVFVHHQPDLTPVPSGLTDTQPLLDALLPRRQVKALFFGHTHVWEHTVRDGMHCVNLPAVAYVFKAGQPSGWVDAHLREDGMSLELRCIDTTHPKHGEKLDLNWRNG
jgi:hypothetical protein